MNETARSRLAKAERVLRAAEALLREGHAEFAIGRAYYGMFYVAEALLAERDLGFSKHSAVHSAYGRLFAKTGALDPKYHLWMLEAFERRGAADYGADVRVSPEQVEQMLEQAREFLDAAHEYLNRPGSTDDEA